MSDAKKTVSKPTGNIGTLPFSLREQLNQKLRDNKETYRKIAEWLFAQPDDESVPCSARWLNGSGDDAMERALHACENALGRWFNSRHFARWEKQANLRDDLQRRLRNVETRFESLGDDGKDRYVMSVVLEVMEKIALGEASSEDAYMLSMAYAKVRGLAKDDAAIKVMLSKITAITDDKTPMDYKARLDLIGAAIEKGFGK